MYVNLYDEFMKNHGFHRPFPMHLFHYTNSDSLINIFETSKIWMTHVKYFNDGNEYYDGVELILKLLQRHESELGQELYRSLCSIFTNDQWIDKPLAVAIMAFSAKKDLLSQWRGYTKIGQGFCLGFNAVDLYKQNIKAHLRPCIYDEFEKNKIVEEIIKYLVGKIEKEGKSIDELNSEAFWLFQESAISFKNEAFKEEEEWRLITFPFPTNSERWNFRSGVTTIIPFVKEKIDLKSSLDEVIIGPSVNQDLTKNSLFYLMFKKDIWKNNIYKSSVPYRSL